jgi:hypothetical protein
VIHAIFDYPVPRWRSARRMPAAPPIGHRQVTLAQIRFVGGFDPTAPDGTDQWTKHRIVTRSRGAPPDPDPGRSPTDLGHGCRRLWCPRPPSPPPPASKTGARRSPPPLTVSSGSGASGTSETAAAHWNSSGRPTTLAATPGAVDVEVRPCGDTSERPCDEVIQARWECDELLCHAQAKAHQINGEGGGA